MCVIHCCILWLYITLISQLHSVPSKNILWFIYQLTCNYSVVIKWENANSLLCFSLIVESKSAILTDLGPWLCFYWHLLKFNMNKAFDFFLFWIFFHQNFCFTLHKCKIWCWLEADKIFEQLNHGCRDVKNYLALAQFYSFLLWITPKKAGERITIWWNFLFCYFSWNQTVKYLYILFQRKNIFCYY